MAPTIGDLAVNCGKIVDSPFFLKKKKKKTYCLLRNWCAFECFGYFHHMTLVKVGNTDVPKRGTFTS